MYRWRRSRLRPSDIEDDAMPINRRLLLWGLFFILVGAVPLAVRFGAVSGELAGRWWALWPLIIVGLGVGLILARTPADVLGRLIVTATLGIMVGGVLASGSHLTGFTCGGRGGSAFPTATGTFGDRAQVDVELDCGSMTLAAADGSAWQVAGTDPRGAPPQITAGQDRLVLRPSGGNVPFFEASPDWTVTLPRSTQVTLGITVSAGQARANLGGMKLAGVGMTVNAGSARLDLGEATGLASLDVTVNAGSATLNLPATGTSGSFTVNAGSIAFCVPVGANLRIQANDQLTASTNYVAEGLVRAGNAWTSPSFDPTAANRIELNTTANAGSLTLNPKDGCNG
jgi:hypothetical protein